MERKGCESIVAKSAWIPPWFTAANDNCFTGITCQQIIIYIKHFLAQQLELASIWYAITIIVGDVVTNVRSLKSRKKLMHMNAEQSGREDTALSHSINTLRPRQDGRHFPDDIFKRIFFNEKPLSEPMMVLSTDAYMRHSASMCYACIYAYPNNGLSSGYFNLI